MIIKLIKIKSANTEAEFQLTQSLEDRISKLLFISFLFSRNKKA